MSEVDTLEGQSQLTSTEARTQISTFKVTRLKPLFPPFQFNEMRYEAQKEQSKK